jgi:opacity protein-like surface antigen
MAGTLLFPSMAFAQPLAGLYIGGSVGANFASTMQSAGDTTRIETDAGPMGLVDLGWRFGNGLRVEIEGSYRSNDVRGISTRRGDMLPLSGAGGRIATYALMTNLAYEPSLPGLGLPVHPYIGAGIGYGWLTSDNVHGTGYGRFVSPFGSVTSSDAVDFGSGGAFAYQGFAGFSVPLPFVPGLEATMEYRYFATARANVRVTRVASSTYPGTSVVAGNRTSNGFEAHDNSVLLGLRYNFAVP